MLIVLLAIAFQTPPAAPLVNLRATLRQLVAELDRHRSTYGATPALTGAKHQLRDWIESRLAGLAPGFDTRTFAASVHDELRRAGLLCDDCDSNVLGYVDDIRLTRAGDFLVVVTALGVSCGYDESASLEAAHAKVRRVDHVGDFPEPTLRCTTGADLWQIATRLFEGPKRYYLVRWREPFSFMLAGVSETPYAGCTQPDSRGDSYPDILRRDVH